eukprot:m.35162 g.35162  ORF g.35162 m.35162 type:complete len:108 (-) comp9990_c0_seq10:84-407(-)
MNHLGVSFLVFWCRCYRHTLIFPVTLLQMWSLQFVLRSQKFVCVYFVCMSLFLTNPFKHTTKHHNVLTVTRIRFSCTLQANDGNEYWDNNMGENHHIVKGEEVNPAY